MNFSDIKILSKVWVVGRVCARVGLRWKVVRVAFRGGWRRRESAVRGPVAAQRCARSHVPAAVDADTHPAHPASDTYRPAPPPAIQPHRLLLRHLRKPIRKYTSFPNPLVFLMEVNNMAKLLLE